MKIDPQVLREKIIALSDKEIVQMLHDDPEQYHPEALEIAKEEHKKRGLSPDKGERMHASGKLGIFIKSLEAGAKAGAKAFADANRPGIFRATGSKIVCSHCQSDRFQSEFVWLDRLGLTHVSAYMLTCSNCGMIQWLSKSPERE